MAEQPDEVEEDAEKAQLEGQLIDAEVMLRMAWNLLDDLAESGRVPKAFVAKVEKLHDELVDLIPEDES